MVVEASFNPFPDFLGGGWTGSEDGPRCRDGVTWLLFGS